MQGRSFRQANICIEDFKRLRLTALGRKVGKGWDGDGQKRVHLMGGGRLLGLTQGPRGLTDDEFDDRQTDMLM